MKLQQLIERWKCELSSKMKPDSHAGLFSNIVTGACKHNVLRFALSMQRKLSRRHAVIVSVAAIDR